MHGFHLGFLHWIKESVGLDEQGLITKTQSLAAFSCPWRAVSHNSLLCGQASASCKSLSLVNLVRPLHWFWWDVREIHIQLKPLKLIPVMDTSPAAKSTDFECLDVEPASLTSATWTVAEVVFSPVSLFFSFLNCYFNFQKFHLISFIR